MAIVLLHLILNLEPDGHSLPNVLGSVASHSIWVAQAFEDNLGTSIQAAWSNFIESGQVWALLIGFGIGYMFRSITSY